MHVITYPGLNLSSSFPRKVDELCMDQNIDIVRGLRIFEIAPYQLVAICIQ